MKLKELLDRIKSNPKVKRIDFIEKHPPYYHFYRIMTEEDEDLVREFAVCIIVENEGAENEVAYFKDSKPLTGPPTPSPIEQVKQKVVEKCGFIKVESFTVDNNEKYALVTGFIQNPDGTVSRKTFLVYLDDQGKLTTNEVV